MKTNKFVALSISCALIILMNISCKKNDEGGKAEIHALIYHGSTEIRNSTLYVKFGATSAPSDPTSDYDMKLNGESGDNHVHIEELRRGDYYLYAVGMDTVTHQSVKGGSHVEIKWKDRKKLIEADVMLN